MCSYMKIINLLFAVVCVPYRSCLSVKTSRACYGSDGIPCTMHTLECSSGIIAIQDAYYTNSTNCTSDGLSRCYTNISNIPDTGRYRDFNETQLNNLYTKCSVKERCTLYPVRSSVFTFSVVKFMCINDFHNLCDQVGATTSDASLLWKGNNSSIDDHNCTCSISTLQSNTYFSLTALDMRFNNRRQICPGVNISVDGNSLPVNCSQLSPYQLLVNTSQQIQVTVNKGEADVNGIVWLRLRGSNAVKLICNEKVTAATDIVRTSKACYGVQSPMLPCTKHTLECSSGMIAIQDAYYTNSIACPLFGLSSCYINVSSIPDTGKYQNFSESQLVNLYKSCSNKLRCTFTVGRRTTSAVFSIVKFICINEITSKACFGPQGLPCTKHTLECSSGMIAIQDAYYTNSTACGLGLSSCGNINVSSIPDTGRYQDLSETQLNTLYRDCSAQQRCTFNGERRNVLIIISVVKFTCIYDVYNLCGQVNTRTSDATLLWKRNNIPDEFHTCTCSISTLQSNTILSLTALDMRLSNTWQLCPGVTITVDGNSLPVNCSQLSPYQLLVNTSQQVQVTVNEGEVDVNGVVWLRIQGSNTMQLICNEKFVATTDFVSTTFPYSNSIKTSSSTADFISTVTSTTATETAGNSNTFGQAASPKSTLYEFQGGIYMAGVSTGVVVSLFCGFLIYFLFIRRRFVLTKKQDSIPPSAAHPTYDGLTELQQPNNYDVINHQNRSENMLSSLYENVANRP